MSARARVLIFDSRLWALGPVTGSSHDTKAMLKALLGWAGALERYGHSACRIPSFRLRVSVTNSHGDGGYM